MLIFRTVNRRGGGEVEYMLGESSYTHIINFYFFLHNIPKLFIVLEKVGLRESFAAKETQTRDKDFLFSPRYNG